MPDNLKHFLSKKSFVIIFALVFGLSFLLIFFNLGKNPPDHYRQEENQGALAYNTSWTVLDNPFFAFPMHYRYLNYHEYRYATVAQRILETGNWASLEVKNLGENLPYYQKGPVYFMLAAILGKIFGLSVVVARFWPAFFGFGVLVLVYLISRNIFNKYIGLLATAILATTFQFIHVDGARAISIDTIFIFFVLLAFYALSRQAKNKKMFYLAAGAISAAALTRSVFMTVPLVIIFPLIDITLTKNIDWKKMSLKWFFATAIIFTIVGSWVGLQYAAGGEKYFKELWKTQIEDEFLNKLQLASPVMYDNFQYSLFLNERPKKIFFYPWVVFKGFFPWSMFAPISFAYAVYLVWKKKNRQISALLLLVTAISVFMLIKEQAWARYANNLYPFLAIFLGKAFYDLSSGQATALLRWGVFGTLALFFSVIMPFNFSSSTAVSLSTSFLLVTSFFYAIFSKNSEYFTALFPKILFGYFLIVAIINVLQPFVK